MDTPKADIFVLCDHASISQEQKLSIVGIFDNFFVRQTPTTWPRMFLVAVLKGDPNADYPLKLKINPPSGSKANYNEKDLTLKFGPGGKTNFMTELVNFQIPDVGKYKIELISGKKEVASITFSVTKTAEYGVDKQGKKISN